MDQQIAQKLFSLEQTLFATESLGKSASFVSLCDTLTIFHYQLLDILNILEENPLLWCVYAYADTHSITRTFMIHQLGSGEQNFGSPILFLFFSHFFRSDVLHLGDIWFNNNEVDGIKIVTTHYQLNISSLVHISISLYIRSFINNPFNNLFHRIILSMTLIK